LTAYFLYYIPDASAAGVEATTTASAP